MAFVVRCSRNLRKPPKNLTNLFLPEPVLVRHTEPSTIIATAVNIAYTMTAAVIINSTNVRSFGSITSIRCMAINSVGVRIIVGPV